MVVEKTLGGKVQDTFPPSLEIPQTARDFHFPHNHNSNNYFPSIAAVLAIALTRYTGRNACATDNHNSNSFFRTTEKMFPACDSVVGLQASSMLGGEVAAE
jgi:hypothetical protein